MQGTYVNIEYVYRKLQNATFYDIEWGMLWVDNNY